MRDFRSRKLSLFNLMVLLFSFAAIVIVIVNNIIKVNSLAIENNQLQNEIYKSITFNNNLQTEIERLTTYDNIKHKAGELGLINSSIRPGRIILERNTVNLK